MASVKEELAVFDRYVSLLRGELGWLPPEEAMHALYQAGTIRRYAKGEAVIAGGTKCSDVFTMMEGIVRFVDTDGDRERTFAFALPGTLFMSKHSFTMDLPSYYHVEACCDSIIHVVRKRDFWQVVHDHPDLAIWMLNYAYGELFYQEYKNSEVHKGSARDRYLNMLSDRPEIIRTVSQRVVASYLGITPEYLSHLKKEFSEGQ